jgi:hypothetical protein
MDGHAHVVRPVVNPDLAPRIQRWLLRLIARRIRPARKLLIERPGPIALVICILGAFTNRLADPWLLAVAASACFTFAVRREIPEGGLRRRRQDFVEPSDLNDASVQRLLATQTAIETVLTSEVYRTRQLDSPICDADLRQHEWEIACRLRGITRQRVEHAADQSGGVPGPRSAAVLAAHARAIAIAEDATIRRIQQLRSFANEVRASDLALQDLRMAERLTLRNHKYLALVAESEADNYAISLLTHITEDAALARNAYQEALDRALLAAGPLELALPEPPVDGLPN